MECLVEYKKLPYDLKYDSKRVDEIIRILQAILKLNTETYIRNFSTALFKDSKRFQREFRSTVESVLFDYTDEVVEKNNILGFYNLYENPTFHKGDIDVYGFLILENLKEKTGIPFAPLMMDMVTLERFYQAGFYKELTATDVKVIEGKKDTKLFLFGMVLEQIEYCNLDLCLDCCHCVYQRSQCCFRIYCPEEVCSSSFCNE